MNVGWQELFIEVSSRERVISLEDIGEPRNIDEAIDAFAASEHVVLEDVLGCEPVKMVKNLNQNKLFVYFQGNLEVYE